MIPVDKGTGAIAMTVLLAILILVLANLATAALAPLVQRLFAGDQDQA